ncbi:MAG: Holliday junction branch migration protein RuvA [Candidatus Binatia bacterium]
MDDPTEVHDLGPRWRAASANPPEHAGHNAELHPEPNVERKLGPNVEPKAALSMIARLRGNLEARQVGEVLVDVGGVGYQAFVSLQTFSVLPPVGSDVVLEVVTVLRENALELFGFATAAEKSAFLLLKSVSGIGPRMALAVLSGIRVEELAEAVASGNAQRLIAVPGIGRKTAERMLIDLRGKLDAPVASSTPAGGVEEDAVSALVGLGYKRGEAEKVVRAAAAGGDASLEDVLRRALGGLVRESAR